VRLVELAEPHRHVAADDDRMPARFEVIVIEAAYISSLRQQIDGFMTVPRLRPG
jgi:hypothetical protein